MIGIVDYGAGNLASVSNALNRLGVDVCIFNKPQRIMDFQRVILPGVGSFRAAMNSLGRNDWPAAIGEFAASGRPLLGICLGMQLLFDEGEEDGPTPGLGLIPGAVRALQPSETT